MRGTLALQGGEEVRKALNPHYIFLFRMSSILGSLGGVQGVVKLALGAALILGGLVLIFANVVGFIEGALGLIVLLLGLYLVGLLKV